MAAAVASHVHCTTVREGVLATAAPLAEASDSRLYQDWVHVESNAYATLVVPVPLYANVFFAVQNARPLQAVCKQPGQHGVHAEHSGCSMCTQSGSQQRCGVP